MNCRQRRVQRDGLVLAIVGLAGLTAVALADPATNPLFPRCLWRAATGWLCPGCGSARAIHAVLHGHFGAALLANPVAVAAVPLATAEVVRRLCGRHTSGSSGVRPGYVHALAFALIMFGVLRNVFV